MNSSALLQSEVLVAICLFIFYALNYTYIILVPIKVLCGPDTRLKIRLGRRGAEPTIFFHYIHLFNKTFEMFCQILVRESDCCFDYYMLSL